ncbi:MAG TPA: glycosyltransferase family 39 protein, partial [Blastocatellia bacterium]|nr:glycosyltransferase family 39 protein [Blastocatellia bacterium]
MVRSAHPAQPTVTTLNRWFDPSSTPSKSVDRKRIILILISLAVGLSARLYQLSAAGLAEDEAAKILAIRSYTHGDFTANSEHPMLMKLACLASLKTSDSWNSIVGRRFKAFDVSLEAALRFPNALFGALTVIPLFFLAESLLGSKVAAISSLMWASGLNAIWFNRIAKEDTLLVFFMLASYCLYNRAKNLPIEDTVGQARVYTLSGFAAGLMGASKYLPHFYGLMVLFYHLAGFNRRNNRPVPFRMKAMHVAAMVVTLMVFDFALFLPGTWRYVWSFIHGDFQTHHGYVMMGRLYPNDMGATPGGPPWYLYYLYLLVKAPVPIVAAFIIGLIQIVTHRRARRGADGYLFLRIMLVFWL